MMKPTKTFFAILVVFIIVSSCYCLSEELWLIESGRCVGWIELGENIDKVIDFYGGVKLQMGSLYWYKDEGIEFYAPEKYIEEIIIVKPSHGATSYCTATGISIGSPYEEIEKAYGAVERAIYSKESYALNYFEKGISFYIKDDAVCKIVIYKRLGGCNPEPSAGSER